MTIEDATPLIALDEVVDGTVRRVRVPGREALAVCRVGADIFVTQDRCSHAKASLSEGWMEGHSLCCPVHDGSFDVRDGRPLCFPVTDPIQTFPAQVVDGVIYADLRGARSNQEVQE